MGKNRYIDAERNQLIYHCIGGHFSGITAVTMLYGMVVEYVLPNVFYIQLLVASITGGFWGVNATKFFANYEKIKTKDPWFDKQSFKNLLNRFDNYVKKSLVAWFIVIIIFFIFEIIPIINSNIQ